MLQKKGFLLLDTGAQYIDGTTDTTRTYALGELAKAAPVLAYVLKSNIAMARTVFMEGCSGANLDIMARNQVWRYGIDYRCGTGHSMGFVRPHPRRPSEHADDQPRSLPARHDHHRRTRHL